MGLISVKPRIGCAALMLQLQNPRKPGRALRSTEHRLTTLSKPYDTAASESFKIAMSGQGWRNTFALHCVCSAVVSTHGSAGLKKSKNNSESRDPV